MKEPILICPVCGNEYKARMRRGKRQVTCSKECMYKRLYPNSNLKYFAEKYNTTEEGFMQIIDKEHNEGKQTIKALSEKYGIARITLKRLPADRDIILLFHLSPERLMQILLTR